MENEIYKEHILNHYRNPRNKYALVGARRVGKETNALCGDEVTIYAHVDDTGMITTMSFTGDGCAISQAAASLFTDWAKGKQEEEIQHMTQKDMEQLLGITLSAVRARCALLPVRALQNAYTTINGSHTRN
ncbi:MAG: nitrogen fixation protein NifU [Parcubacteria group bacterium Gr01-1014_70]|nr:MAG: nitrogen fixation protein NifU [Parcubacteria group bacterium Gr01-1014_70]